MDVYPVNLNVKNKNCLVVGCGKVGTRKIKTLLKSKAFVTIVSPEIPGEIEKTEVEKLTIYKREYKSSDMEGVFLVIGATNNSVLNRKIADDAGKYGALCNIIDNPERCDFTLPSVISKGDLTISVSTGGKSPYLAKKIREELEDKFGTEYKDVLIVMGIIREKVLKESDSSDINREKFSKIIDAGLLEMTKNKRYEDIDKLLLDSLGEGFIFKELLKQEQ